MSNDYKYKGFTFVRFYFPYLGTCRYKLLLPQNRVVWFDSKDVLHDFVDDIIERVHLCGF